MGFSEQRSRIAGIDSIDADAEPNSDADHDKVRVEAIMESRPLSLGAETRLDEAVDTLVQHSLTGLPVVDPLNRKVVGFLSQKDCLPRLHELQDWSISRGAPLKVADVMSRHIQSLELEQSVEDVYKLFLDEWYHVYPVVDADGALIGTVSREQILAFFSKKDQMVSE